MRDIGEAHAALALWVYFEGSMVAEAGNKSD